MVNTHFLVAELYFFTKWCSFNILSTCKTTSPSDCSLEASYFLNLVNCPWHKVVLLLKVTWPYNDTFISACQESIFQLVSKFNAPNPLDTGRKLNVYRTFRRRSGRLLYALFTFNFCLVFKVGYLLCKSD